MSPQEEDSLQDRIDLELWRRIFRFALNHKRLLYPLAFSAVLLSLVEVAFPLVTMWAVKHVGEGGDTAGLAPIALAYIGLSLALSALVFTFIQCAGGISHHIAFDIKRDSFRRLQELEFAFYDKQPTGWLISRLTADCDRLSRVLAWGFLDVLWGLCLVAAMSIAMLWLNWKLALVALSVLPPLIVASVFFQRRMLTSSRQIRKHNARITASYNEGIAGVKTTKTLRREEKNLEEFEGMSTDMYQASIRRAFLSAVYLPIVMLLGSLGSGLALWQGGLSVLGEAIDIGTLVAFVTYAGIFFNPINQIAVILAEIQGAQAAGERVMGLLATQPKIKDSEEVAERVAANASAAPGKGLAIDGYPKRIDEIRFREVDFSYDKKQTVLKGFNLEARRGQTVALVGPSGGGKSTIVSLASRFYEPTGGQILIDGIDYRERSIHWLQSQLGIVLQTPHLFNGSLLENIRYGRLDASDEEVRQAAITVNAHGFIEELERGYETSIGEGGARLSTGERQLVSFARALLANPQIFIMDEATSSIDAQTEKLIQAGLQRVFEGRISFVIAHRLSTISSADKILFINEGRIEEQGTHRELLAARGRYHDLYLNQFRREGESKALASAS